MTRHAARDRMDCVLHFNVALFKFACQLAHGMLGLRDGHSVAGNDYDLAREGHLNCRVGGARRANRAAVFAGSFCSNFAATAAKTTGDDAGDRAVHRFGHQPRQDRSRSADDHAGDDQRRVVERQPGCGGRKACEGVQQ